MQYDTPNPVYVLVFTTISLSNIRRKCSPLQFIKSTRSQNNSVDHILCNQCYCFSSKDIKSTNFADKYPDFFRNLLVGKHLIKLCSGKDLWRMIPTTMHPWWFGSLTDSNQEWSHSYARKITLTFPRPLFEDHTSGLTIFLDDVESRHPERFVRALTNKKEFLLNVMCPFGCSEYCFKGKHIAWDLVIQRLLLIVLLAHINKSSYLLVQHMWDQYDREDDDFDTILLNSYIQNQLSSGCYMP